MYIRNNPQPAKPRIPIGAVLLSLLVMLFAFGEFLEQNPVIPVEHATAADWSPDAFWATPWGKSGVHKGIDIFAPKGTSAIAAVSGVVIYAGEMALGGNVLTLLGPKWWLHYYAHLESVTVGAGDWVDQGQRVGSIGNTGNARGKPPHLHYSVFSLVPSLFRYSSGVQGWKRMFYLNPDDLLPRRNDAP